MKVNLKAAEVSGNSAKVVFASTSGWLSEELSLSHKAIIDILKSTDDTCIKISEAKSSVIPIYNQRVYIISKSGYNYFCNLTDQAISSLKQIAGMMVSKKKKAAA